jgi:hypothetical protein
MPLNTHGEGLAPETYGSEFDRVKVVVSEAATREVYENVINRETVVDRRTEYTESEQVVIRQNLRLQVLSLAMREGTFLTYEERDASSDERTTKLLAVADRLVEWVEG